MVIKQNRNAEDMLSGKQAAVRNAFSHRLANEIDGPASEENAPFSPTNMKDKVSLGTSDGGFFTYDRKSIQQRPAPQSDESIFSDWSHAEQDKAYTAEKLKKNWLSEAERMVEKHYGLRADGENTLTIRFEDNPDVSYLAAVSYFPHEDDALSRATDQTLTLVTSKFPQGQDESGGYSPFYGDRVVAHEMVHAIMGQTMDMDSLDTWFKEGSAELIHGAEERVLYHLSGEDGELNNGYSETDIDTFAADTTFFDQWGSSSEHYAKAYLATRFMHEDIVAHGGEGIKDVMTFLTDEKMLATGNATLDNALGYLSYKGLTSYDSEEAFKTAFRGQAPEYIRNLNLANEDTGAIGGFDVDGGDIKTAQTVVDNSKQSKPGRILKGYSNVIFA